MSRRMIATFASAAGRAASASSSSSSIGGSSVVVESITSTTARTSGARWLLSSRHHSSSSSSSSLARRLRLSEATSSSRLCIRREGSTTSSASSSSSSSPQPVDDDDDDPCPPWQNPLHHNNPDYVGRVLAEDFLPGEEMPIVPLPPFEVTTTNEEDGTSSSSSGVVASPHLHDLANEIVRLSLLEVKELVDRVGDHFGIVDDDDDDYGGGGGGGGDDAVESTVVVEEQTAFDLKLTGFDEKSKIKVIKEIRAVTSLGLKEAKELVEGAPTTVKKAIKKEEAEELKVRLEAAGATVEIV